MNLFCQARHKSQKVLQRKWSHHYIGVPYRYHNCRVRRAHSSTNYRHAIGNKSCSIFSYIPMKQSLYKNISDTTIIEEKIFNLTFMHICIYFVNKQLRLKFPLWTFHLYVVTFQQHLHMEYISISWSDVPEFVVPFVISLIEGCC
jgi:hypothetical protein